MRTSARGTTEITGRIEQLVRQSGLRTGMCHVFLQHTSASLVLCENADPSVRSDLESFLGRLVRDGDPIFRHDTEGDDDMPAHIRSVLTDSSLNLPISNGGLALGPWQGVYLYEHRTSPHDRHVLVTVFGE
ncbi:MAG: secondary thiamine-phosphate synthase enzyme YjbQ [Gammaproteobacteria bacterium]